MENKQTYEDKTLKCTAKDGCGKEFVFTAGEQEFYAKNNFENEPTRCPECRQAKKERNRRPFNNNFNDSFKN